MWITSVQIMHQDTHFIYPIFDLFGVRKDNSILSHFSMIMKIQIICRVDMNLIYLNTLDLLMIQWRNTMR